MHTQDPIFRTHIAILAIVYVIGLGIVVVVRPSYGIAILTVIGIPTFVTWAWLRQARMKVMLFAIVTALLFAPAVELSARLANAWDVASQFPRILGIMPIENLLFAFLNFLWGVSLYEHFVNEQDQHVNVSRRSLVLIALYVSFSVIVFGGYLIDPRLVALPYHIIALIVLLVPLVFLQVTIPHLWRRSVFVICVLTVTFGLFEAVSLILGYWWWPGTYLFTLRIGEVVFPLDDVFIWYLLSTVVLVGGYEYFVNGHTKKDPPVSRI